MGTHLQTTRAELEMKLAPIYDKNHPGVVFIENILTPRGLTSLVAQTRKIQDAFRPAAAQMGRARQRFSHLYFELDEFADIYKHVELGKLLDEYNTHIAPVITAHGLSVTTANSLGVHNYPRSDEGIGAHRDNRDVQFVSIFNLTGSADWYTAATYERDGEIKIPVKPNTLLLMRGPRNVIEANAANQKLPAYDSRENICPIHYVGKVHEERIAVLLRHYAYGQTVPLKVAQ